MKTKYLLIAAVLVIAALVLLFIYARRELFTHAVALVLGYVICLNRKGIVRVWNKLTAHP